MSQPSFRYGHDTLDIGTAIALAEGDMNGELSPEVLEKVRASEQHIADIVSANTTVYGVNTGFGILANTRISEDDTRVLQHKILQSHSVGVGKPVPAAIAKLMLVTKIHALARGFSGVQRTTLERILWHIE